MGNGAGLHASEDSGNARFARTLFEQALNRQALRLSLDKEQSLDALDREGVMTLTANDIVEAALAFLGGEVPEPAPSRWWRWLVSPDPRRLSGECTYSPERVKARLFLCGGP